MEAEIFMLCLQNIQFSSPPGLSIGAWDRIPTLLWFTLLIFNLICIFLLVYRLMISQALRPQNWDRKCCYKGMFYIFLNNTFFAPYLRRYLIILVIVQFLDTSIHEKRKKPILQNPGTCGITITFLKWWESKSFEDSLSLRVCRSDVPVVTGWGLILRVKLFIK